MANLQDTILAKKAALADVVSVRLGKLADECAKVWPYAEALDQLFQSRIGEIPNCHLLYAWDVDTIVISSMVTPERVDTSWRGRDLSDRPYLKNNLPFKGIMLSSVYTSQFSNEQCVTALQAITRDNQLLGFIAADFAVSDLLLDSKLVPPELHWRQFRGDPSIRGTVFMQQRVQSLMDEHIDEVNDHIVNLMVNHGVFHAKIHYSSGRISIWLVDDPYDYRIHHVSEIIDPDICLAYPNRPYPQRAKTPPSQIREVLDEFKSLRFADETIYLRSASINIMNGMLGLTFSCDGSHYMPVEEFLEKNLAFWLGSLTGNEESEKSAATG
jgi:hypothetical protein